MAPEAVVVQAGSEAVAIERRGNGVEYYTYRRKGGRDVKEYGGHGSIAVLAARLDAAKRKSVLYPLAELLAWLAERSKGVQA